MLTNPLILCHLSSPLGNFILFYFFLFENTWSPSDFFALLYFPSNKCSLLVCLWHSTFHSPNVFCLRGHRPSTFAHLPGCLSSHETWHSWKLLVHAIHACISINLCSWTQCVYVSEFKKKKKSELTFLNAIFSFVSQNCRWCDQSDGMNSDY